MRTRFLQHLCLGVSEICFWPQEAASIAGSRTRLSPAICLPVTSFSLFCEVLLTLNLQVKILGHVGNNVGYQSCAEGDKPLENKHESESCSQNDPILFAQVVWIVWFMEARVSTRCNSQRVILYFCWNFVGTLKDSFF